MSELLIVIMLIASLLVSAYYLLLLHDTISSKNAPVIMSPPVALEYISKALDIKKGDIVADLGCGNAEILLYLHGNFPEAKYLGYENGFIPFLKSYMNCIGKKNIKIIFKDINKIKLLNANKVYLYLSPELIKKVVPSIKKNTTIVSLSYEVKSIKPTKVINLKHPSILAKRIYIYKK